MDSQDSILHKNIRNKKPSTLDSTQGRRVSLSWNCKKYETEYLVGTGKVSFYRTKLLEKVI